MARRFLKKTATLASPAPDNLPRHIAIIMDGNGRWAKQRGLPRIAGHKKGAETLRSLLFTCRDAGIRYLTVYAFSAENWQRPKDEVDDLMQLLSTYLASEVKTLTDNRIRLHVIGDMEKLSPGVRAQVDAACAATAAFDEFHLAVCLSYGARQEITRAMQKLAQEVHAGTVSPESITEASISARLFTHELPEPDLLIRTGGEQRMSNFLLWQAAYTELYFSDILWPDFTGGHLLDACREYATRERRYGKTN